MKKLLTLMIIGVIVSKTAVYGLAAQTDFINVTLPSFNITLNGLEINNKESKYPLIVYKDITYFPMTYNACRFLGIETFWKESSKELNIETTGITAAYKPYTNSTKNSNKYKAIIPNFSIIINGNTVDNSKEKYPLLSFRDITYFPMTWKYSVDEFGWQYNFNSNGLSINSDNIKLKQINLPKDRDKKDNVIANDKFIYYEDVNGRIMQINLYDTTKIKEVYKLPIAEYGDGDSYVWANLLMDEGNAFLSYHQGGATMGTEYLISLNDDGTTTVVNDARVVYKSFEDKQFRYYIGPAPGENNLFMKKAHSEWKNIGNPNYLYGWIWVTLGNSAGGGGSKDIHLINGELYILAFDMKNNSSTTSIYKINLNTNETSRILDKEILAFTADDNYLYYESEGVIYKYSIKTKIEEVYSSIVNPNASLDEMKVMGDKNQYLVCTFIETPESKYRIMVLNKDGEIIFKTSDTSEIDKISIIDDSIYFYNKTTQTICIGDLKTIN